MRLAEQIAVLDNAAPGRLWVVVGAGYRVEEFEMAGVEHAARGRILEEYVGVMQQAFSGEPFEWQGRTVVVTPKPATLPHPMLLMGGGVPAAARRAARLRLPMLPMNTDQSVRDAYAEEGKRVGYKGFLVETTGPTFVHVADDPDRAWAEIGKYVLYEAQTYASYQTPGQHSTPGVKAETVDDLQRVAPVRGGDPRAGARPAGTGSGRRERHAEPAGRRTAPGHRVVEPRVVRGGGPAAPAFARARSARSREKTLKS